MRRERRDREDDVKVLDKSVGVDLSQLEILCSKQRQSKASAPAGSL